MLCADCEQIHSTFERALSKNVDALGVVPLAFKIDPASFKATVCILWRTGIVLTEMEQAYGKSPTKFVLSAHKRAFKEFMYDAKLYMKGERQSLLHQPEVRVLRAPAWRKGTPYETVLPFIIHKQNGLLVLGALVGQVVLVALLSRPANWDAWYALGPSCYEVPPELQAELKRLLDDGMTNAIERYRQTGGYRNKPPAYIKK